MRMSKHALSKEIQRELAKLNDAIDRKIVRGQSFVREARRHKELLCTLRRIMGDEGVRAGRVRRAFARLMSPARRSIAAGAVGRLFSFGVA